MDPETEVTEGEKKTKIEPVKVSREYFDFDSDDRLHFGLPLWYVLRVKNNQIRMLKERGYQPRTEDTAYQSLTLNNLSAHLNKIAPNTYKEDMTGIYTIRENHTTQRQNILVYYPEFKPDKAMTKINQEPKDIVHNITLILDLGQPIVDKSGSVKVRADPKIYASIFIPMGGEYNIKTREWIFKAKDRESIELFLNENQKKPYINHIMIISYAGLASQTRKELVGRPMYSFEEFTYSNLSYVPIDHLLAAEYQKLTTEEWQKVVADNKMVGKELNTKIIPKLLHNDVFVRYYGALIGDIFFIKYKNYLPYGILESKYSHVEYRVVVRDPKTVG